jgi:hypothetical protein
MHWHNCWGPGQNLSTENFFFLTEAQIGTKIHPTDQMELVEPASM